MLPLHATYEIDARHEDLKHEANVQQLLRVSERSMRPSGSLSGLPRRHRPKISTLGSRSERKETSILAADGIDDVSWIPRTPQVSSHLNLKRFDLQRQSKGPSDPCAVGQSPDKFKKYESWRSRGEWCVGIKTKEVVGLDKVEVQT